MRLYSGSDTGIEWLPAIDAPRSIDLDGRWHFVGVQLFAHRIRTDYARDMKNLHFVAGDVFALPISDGLFDVVFMNLVLHHRRLNLAEALLRMRAALKSGGRLFAIEPNVYALDAHLHDAIGERRLAFASDTAMCSSGGWVPRRHRTVLWRDRRWARNRFLATSFAVEAVRS
jgi:SAM-dependent methyltransferase